MNPALRKLRNLVRRTREVGPAGIAMLVKAFCLMLAARVALRMVPVRKLIAFKQRPMRSAVAAQAAESVARVRWSILVVARYSPVQFVCFPQCLAAAELLRRADVPTRLHYGVAREGAKLITHTWLEAGGEIVIGGEVAGQYSTLDIF